MVWGVSAAVQAALESSLSARAEEEYARSAATDLPEPAGSGDPLLPRRTPTVPRSAQSRSAQSQSAQSQSAQPQSAGAQSAGAQPGRPADVAEPAAPLDEHPEPPTRPGPDLVLLDQVLRGLQRLA